MVDQTQLEFVRSELDLPENNPTERVGKMLPAEGEDGLFSQSWFPICLSTELPKGKLRGENFLDGKVVAFRGEDGVARVMSAFCPHLGADLSVGDVTGNHVRCAFHRWEYGGDGSCVKTAIGDPAPAKAKLFKFPTIERYGIIWAFNGEAPDFDVPNFAKPDDEIAIRTFRFPEPLRCDPWVFAANTPDMQHFKVVHKIQFKTDDPHDSVEWSEHGFRYTVIAGHQEDVPIEWKVGIRGTSIYWQEGPYGDCWMGGMVGFALPKPGIHTPFAVIALEKGEDTPEGRADLDERFATAELLMQRTVSEDEDILNTIRYRPGTLSAGDRTLGKYLQLLRRFPRAHPSGPFIK